MIVDLDIKNERLIELIRIVCNEEIQRLPSGLEYYNYREYSIDKNIITWISRRML